THVHLHRLHALGRLDRDATGVEGDALADEGRAGVAACTAAVAQHDEARRLLAALGDAHQRTHASGADLVGAEDLTVQADLLGHLARTLGQLAGGQHIGRLVAQRAREILRLRQDAPALDGRPQRRLAPTPQDGDRLDAALGAFARPLFAGAGA